MSIKKIIKKIIFRLRAEYTTESLISMGLKVGKNFQRNEDVIIDPSHCWLIEIGDNVVMAPRVHILAHDASTRNHLGYTKIGRVTIGNNVFIGASSIVLPNVKIGSNSIIGANSTVSSDIPDNVVAFGSPAKVICTLEKYIEKNKKLMDVSPVYDEEYTLRKKITSEKKQEQFDALEQSVGYVK